MMQSVSSQKSKIASIACGESFADEEKEASKQLSILNLPIEITCEIFSYFDVRTLIITIGLVCKAWNDLVRGDCLWRYFRYLSFEQNEIPSQLLQMIRKCLCLRHLEIRAKDYFMKEKCSCLFCTEMRGKDFQLMGTSIFSVLSHIRNLKSFCLRGFRVDSTCKNVLREFLKYSPKLTSLDLGFCEISEVYEAVSEAKNVKVLNLAGYHTIQTQTLTEVIDKLNNLEQINLSYQDYLEESDINSIVQLRSETLTSLTLRNVQLKDNAFVCIGNCLNLSALSIFCTGLTDITLHRVQKLPLQELVLHQGHKFSQSGLTNFCEHSSISQLKYLDVRSCFRFGNSALKLVAERCQDLLGLNVKHTQVTDFGIFQVTRKCPKLMLLEVNHLKMKGYFLHDIHVHLKFLKFLDLTADFDMDVTFINDFIMSHPDFKVITGDFESFFDRFEGWKIVIQPDFEPHLIISQEIKRLKGFCNSYNF